MTPGTAVIWKEKPTRVRSLETIVRADGSPLECAVLHCNRFVRISELRLESEIRTGERHDVSQASDLQSRYRSNEQDSPPVALKKSPRASQKTNGVIVDSEIVVADPRV